MLIRTISVIFVLILTLLTTYACVGPAHYRDNNAATSLNDCAIINDPFHKLGEKYFNGRAACAVQRFETELTTKRPGEQSQYTLGFLELDELGNHKQNQLDALHTLLDSPRKKYVMVFVHGWRHNADIMNNDVRRFHTVLGYSRSFLNQRVDKLGDVDLIGIYVGWRGKSLREPNITCPPLDNETDEDFRERDPCKISAAISFPFRKATSERIAKPLIRHLKSIEQRLDLQGPGKASDKMLVIGHSLGGNALLTGLVGMSVDHIEKRTSRDEPLGPLLGDLTVLINPASEAWKWAAIQKTLHDVAGGSPELGPTAKPAIWRKSFPITQRPIMMALTNTANWEDYENSEFFDEATLKYFYWNQAITRPFSRRRDKVALGHIEPNKVPKENGEKIYHPFGVSHDLKRVSSIKIKTDLRSLSLQEASACHQVDGWLPKIRKRYFDIGHYDWDTLYTAPIVGHGGVEDTSTLTITAPSSLNPAQLQFVDRANGTIPTNAPFWNLGVTSDVIEGHGGYVSSALLCTLNQFVLDDVASAR